MLSVIIVEDEKPSLKLMKLMINKNKNFNIIGEYTNSAEAYERIISDNPDVVFLDVEMPIMNGTHLAKKIYEYNKNIQIVFITAYPQYAVDAFKVNAANYILKPINEEDLTITAERLLRNHSFINSNIKDKDNYAVEGLGSFKVYEKASKTYVKWPTAKSEELFAYFIYNKSEWHDKWRLCDLLWSDCNAKNAEHNLHSTIYRMKTALKKIGVENIISYNQGIYRVDFTDFKCDIWEFEAFILKNESISKENIQEYEEVISLYKGEIFSGRDYIWSITLKEKFNNFYIKLVKKVIVYYIGRKEFINAEDNAKKLLKLNPYDEEIHKLVLDIYYKAGDRIKLIEHFNEAKKLFHEELGVEFKEFIDNYRTG
jgi:two-component SAPR family response regulator